MKVSFTTLSCPDWSWEKIIEEASGLGYDGIEIRGVEGEMYLPKARPFLPENIESTKEILMKKGLEICCLDTSCSFHNPSSFQNAIEEGKRIIELANKLAVPYIRVFGDSIPESRREEDVIADVASGLQQLSAYAEDKGVMVLLETHGDFSESQKLLSVFDKVTSPAAGVLWDVNHPYKAFGEPISETYTRLGRRIRHTHFKDSKGTGKGAELCLIGEGDLPIRESVSILKQNGYDGWLSLEWEKKWHPEIEEPEIALPQYLDYMRTLLKSLDK